MYFPDLVSAEYRRNALLYAELGLELIHTDKNR